MKRTSILVAFAAALLLPSIAAAQVPAPTPAPETLIYRDPAMRIQVPAGWFPISPQRHVTVDKLPQDPLVVAGWATKGDGAPKALLVQLQAYNGNLDGFDSVYEQQLRSQLKDAIVRGKHPFTLSNGMPAEVLEVTSGDGFSTMKIFVCIWIDGARGVALVMSARLGDLDINTAEAVFKRASATAYPLGRDY